MHRVVLKHIPLKQASRFSGWAPVLHSGTFALFVVFFALVWTRLWVKAAWLPTGSWPEGVLILLAAVTTLVSMSRQLPGQNVLLAALVIAISASAVQVLGALTYMPFGPYLYDKRFGPQLFDVLPWPVPLLWLVALLNARGVARLILRPWRQNRVYGLWVIGLAVVLVVLLDFGLEPFATQVMGYWSWKRTKVPTDWYTTPWVNFLGWAVTTLLILAFVTPALINKRPVRHSPALHPLFIWLLLSFLLMTGVAVHRLWPATALTLAQTITVTIFSVLGPRHSSGGEKLRAKQTRIG